MKTPSKEGDGSWVKVWVTGYVGTAPSFTTKAVQPFPLTDEEKQKLADEAKAAQGPGFDD